MRQLLQFRLVLILALAAGLMFVVPVSQIAAQEDSNETPLGDIARNLRKKTPAVEPVIDDDNLSSVMEQAESRRASGKALRFLMAGGERGFQVSAPDVTCSLSFSANVKSLLSGQFVQMELPPADLAKLEGPATIEGDTLTVSVFNGTSWHVSELAVAFTVVKKAADLSLSFGPGSSLPASSLPGSEIRPEKKPDATVIYRMRAAAPPFSTTVFSAPLDEGVPDGAEWHWAILQARGYPPDGYSVSASSVAAHPDPATSSSAASPAPQSSSALLPQAPH